MYIHKCMHTIIPGGQFWLFSATMVAVNFFITLLLLSGVRRALLAVGKSDAEVRRIVSAVGISLWGWLILAVVLAWQGTFRSALDQPVPYIALAIGLPI